MSSEIAEIDGIEWENVARKIFYECLASSSPSSSISSLSSLSSTTSRISVTRLVDYIRENASGNYRNKSLLDELQKSIEEVSWDGQVNYQSFKKASRHWIARIQRYRMQDGNNNTPKDDSSDELLQSRSDDEKQNSVDSNDNDTTFEQLSQICRKSQTRKFVTADFVDLLNVSSYSPSSDTTNGCAMSDSTADDTDSGCGVVGGVPGDLSHIDLRLRVRRFDEENALLREEIVRAEENAAGLQRQLENLRRKLDRTREKCRQLENENDEHQEILNEAEQKERDCRLALQKVEKEKGTLERKLENAETERQQITVLNAKLECCKKKKFEFMKEATACRWEFEEKLRECDLLKEQLADMTEANKNLQESYDKTVQCLREKIQEMKDEKFLLHTPVTGDPSDSLCSTPPIGYFHPHKESTPCDNSSVTMQDSLYDELKASGFSVANESRIRELEDDLCWCNEKMRHAVNKINDIIEHICHSRATPYVPNLHLDDSAGEKTSEISSLFRKISELSNMVNEIIWKPKVKDASSQLSVDSQCTNQQLSRQFGILSFEDHLDFISEKLEHKAARKGLPKVVRERDVFVEAFSMNSRLLGEYVEEVEIADVADDCHKTDTIFSPPCKESMSTPLRIQEDNIIAPIVQEIDRILECTNNNKQEDELTLNSPPSKNPRYTRCIYTCAQPAFDQLTKKIDDPITDSTLSSTKGLPRDLAATYVVSSGGDGLPQGMVDHTATNSENTLEDNQSKVITSHCLKTSVNLRAIPKRKISVFHRSFDIDTMQAGGEIGGCDTYRLTERSMSTPSEQEKTVDDRMELDPECMKMTPNTRKFLLNYRTKDNDSDSSDSLSPLQSLGIHRDTPSVPKFSSQTCARPIILAPTKLKLPFLKEIPPFGNNEKKPTESICDDQNDEKIEISYDKKIDGHETDSSINETEKTCELTNVEASEEISTKIEPSLMIEMIRPGDEIERGVTYRRTSISGELNFSDYSLLSPLDNTSIDNEAEKEAKLESVSKVVLSSEGESTSCDSSPKHEPPVIQVTPKLPLLSTYEKPQITDRSYPRQDPLKSRSSWLDNGMEVVSGYQIRNDSTNVVSCYNDVGGVSGGIRGQDEKANVVPAVALAMSSGEDSSDSECDPMAIRRDEDDDRRNNVVNETHTISPNVLPFLDGALLGTSTPAPPTTINNNLVNPTQKDDCRGTSNLMTQKRDKRERLHTIRRSLSESGCGQSKCRYQMNNGNPTQEELEKEETRPTVFPSLTDVRLQESGIANLGNSDELGGNLSEADLERKYTALSIGLVTDRVTLPRRMALSIRQRDQSERNLASEFQKMQQDIQDLAPLCIDRESVERVERVRHQLEMITQCAHRVSCTAETLGAVHQEHRISRAILLADRYLLVLRSRCEKLASDLAETKRILMENNIVVEEHNGELGDDMPRIRYRGMPTNNRTMMARRRASIATIFRPLSNFQDVTKDGARQRNSVSGRVTLRRPSLSAESQKWEAEKLDRTDSSSSSIGELREIFEQAESRRNSREENNNNVLRLHSSNFSIRDCENNEVDVWTNAREEIVPELPVNVDGCHESQHGRKISMSCWTPKTHVPWRIVVLCIVISFFFGFFVEHAVSSVNQCSGKHFKWWSIEEILGRYLPVKNDSPRPI